MTARELPFEMTTTAPALPLVPRMPAVVWVRLKTPAHPEGEFIAVLANQDLGGLHFRIAPPGNGEGST